MEASCISIHGLMHELTSQLDQDSLEYSGHRCNFLKARHNRGYLNIRYFRCFNLFIRIF